MQTQQTQQEIYFIEQEAQRWKNDDHHRALRYQKRTERGKIVILLISREKAKDVNLHGRYTDKEQLCDA
jgi:hypothetical protein